MFLEEKAPRVESP